MSSRRRPHLPRHSHPAISLSIAKPCTQSSNHHATSRRSKTLSISCNPSRTRIIIPYRQTSKPSKAGNRSGTRFRITKALTPTTASTLTVSGLQRLLDEAIDHPDAHVAPLGMPTEKPAWVRKTGNVYHAPRSGALRASGNGGDGGDSGREDGDDDKEEGGRGDGNSGGSGGGDDGGDDGDENPLDNNENGAGKRGYVDIRYQDNGHLLWDDLYTAICSEDDEQLSSLLAKKGDDDWLQTESVTTIECLWQIALRDGYTDELKLFVKNGIDPEAVMEFNNVPNSTCTVLMLASARFDIPTVKVLLEAGADVTKRDSHGATAVAYAAHTARCNPHFAGDRLKEVTEMLIKASGHKPEKSDAIGEHFCFGYCNDLQYVEFNTCENDWCHVVSCIDSIDPKTRRCESCYHCPGSCAHCGVCNDFSGECDCEDAQKLDTDSEFNFDDADESAEESEFESGNSDVNHETHFHTTEAIAAEASDFDHLAAATYEVPQGFPSCTSHNSSLGGFHHQPVDGVISDYDTFGNLMVQNTVNMAEHDIYADDTDPIIGFEALSEPGGFEAALEMHGYNMDFGAQESSVWDDVGQ